MFDNSEKTKFIEDFLLRVSRGTSFIEDIWIQRDVRRPGTGTQESTEVTEAYSLSGNSISNIKDLLEDDLNYTFEQGFFAFRLITAIAGSGKTTLLNFLEKLIEFRSDYCNRSVVIRFDLPKILSVSSSQSFRLKLYSYILAKTFQEVLKNQEIQNIAEHILRDILGDEKSADLRTATKLGFLPAFNRLFTESGVELEDIFFYLIEQVLKVKQNYTFVYLIDELDDVLRENPDSDQPIRSVFRSLINKASQDYGQKINLMIYLAGTSDIVKKFITEDLAFESRVRYSVIRLVPGRNEEFKRIKDKITRRIQGAYQGKEKFEEAFIKIQNIPTIYSDHNKILRNFCQEYAGRVLEIYQQYFREESENYFDGTDRQLTELVKAECERQWKEHLGRYELKVDSTIMKSKEHTFNCYARLEENGRPVAMAYGGAKSYELLKGYLDFFIQQLKTANFRPFTSNDKPSDISFIIAPECSFLLENSLISHQIAFVNSQDRGKTIQAAKAAEEETKLDENNTNETPKCIAATDINLDDKDSIQKALNGTDIGNRIIDRIIDNRPYKNLDDLVSKVKFIGLERRKKIQQKIDSGQICFQIGVFLCHNSKEKPMVKKIAEQLVERKVSVWLDEWDLVPGDHWPSILEEQIESDNLRAAAIFIGKEGMGPWQSKEMTALLRKCVSRGHRVIPVILKSCKEEPKLPTFIEDYHRVDFRKSNPAPLEHLIQGIKSGRVTP